jgi:hypothetical protein
LRSVLVLIDKKILTAYDLETGSTLFHQKIPVGISYCAVNINDGRVHTAIVIEKENCVYRIFDLYGDLESTQVIKDFKPLFGGANENISCFVPVINQNTGETFIFGQ